MSIRGWIRPLLFGAVALVAGWGSLETASASSQTTGALFCSRATADSNKTCNCTDQTASMQVCNLDQVEVEIGSSSIGHFNTGQSTSTCVTVNVDSQRCTWIRYYFNCCRNWWGFWDCTYEHESLKDAPATPEDCE